MKRIKTHITNIRKSKDGRTLVANFGYLSLLQVAGYIFPLITIPYLARVIGVDGFGKIAFASAIMVWINSFTDWGFKLTSTRDIARNRDDIDKISEIFSNTIWAQSLLMVFAFVLLAIVVLLVPTFRENQAIIFISFLLVPGRIMFPDWFFQAIEKMRFITILNLISKFIFTLAVFVFIKEKSDFLLQPLLITLGYTVSGLISMYIILRKWNVKLKRANFYSIIRTIKDGTDVFLNDLTPNLYNSFSRILLGFWGGPVSNGILDAGGKFISIFEQLMKVIARTFFPFLSRRMDKHELYVRLNFTLSLSFSILLFLFSPLLIKWFFTSEFHDAILISRILSFSIFIIAIRNVYGTHYLLIKGYEKVLRNLTLYGSLVGFILSFPFIYYLDYLGAAINIILAQAIMAILVIIKAKKIKVNE